MNFINQTQARKKIGVSYLGNINSSAKLIKNKKVNNYTYVLYLSPAKTSGKNVCPYSTPECRLGCLHSSGRAKMEIISGRNRIQNARLVKTKLFFEDQDFFMEWMISEMKSYQAKAKREGYYFSARLNGTSDIEWENVIYKGKNIMEIFPDIQFYDYTKNWNRFKTIIPENYHLTQSFTGRNLKQCLSLLSKGINIAVVFNIIDAKYLPETWNGYPVINGDLTDYRPLDGKGVVVGLKWKNIADKALNEQIKHSCFVVQPNPMYDIEYNIKKIAI